MVLIIKVYGGGVIGVRGVVRVVGVLDIVPRY